MTQLKYIGRPPDSDASVVHKEYTDTRYSTIKVDNAYIASVVAADSTNLVTSGYVDSEDALRASKTAVDAADNGYLAASLRGAANGVTPLDADTAIPAANLPTVQTERKATFVQGTAIINGTVVVTTTTPKEFQAGTLTIPDPGYPYTPLFFAQVMGGSTNGVISTPKLGTGNFGQLTVLRNDDTKYGWGLASSHKAMGFHQAVPFADSTTNPATRPPISGTAVFGLWLSLLSGSTYSFNSTGFNFYALIFPGL